MLFELTILLEFGGASAIGLPLCIHLISGGGIPEASHFNSTSSPSAAF